MLKQWIPSDWYIWDCWFAYHEGLLHAFFLQALKAACDFDFDRRHDLSSVGHAVRIGSEWRLVGDEPALQAATDDAWDSMSIWTGSAIHDQMLYTARREEDEPVWTPKEIQRPQQIGMATSQDLITWQRTPASQRGPVIPNPGPAKGFDGVNWRDPYVVRGADGVYCVFICARPVLTDGVTLSAGGGMVAYVQSPTLDGGWSEPRVLVRSTEFYQLEVPQVFWVRKGEHKRLYLLFSAQTEDCSERRRERFPHECETGTYYMMSDPVALDECRFPPLKEPARLLAPGLYSGKLLAWPAAAGYTLFGFQWADQSGQFVGGILGPMDVVVGPDGGLAAIDWDPAETLTAVEA